jgi:hypothetical protein
LIYTKQEEWLEVMLANTVADPWTMVIHLGDTNIANTAMMGSWWFLILAMDTS